MARGHVPVGCGDRAEAAEAGRVGSCGGGGGVLTATRFGLARGVLGLMGERLPEPMLTSLVGACAVAAGHS